MWGKNDSVFVLKVLQRSVGGMNLKVFKELSNLRNDLACHPGLHTVSVHFKSCTAKRRKNSEKNPSRNPKHHQTPPQNIRLDITNKFGNTVQVVLYLLSTTSVMWVENYFQTWLHTVSTMLPNKTHFPNYHCTGEDGAKDCVNTSVC